ncbi:Uncharacterised protein [Bordetella pertussis]|nr:Uncharacterised protein [Bordetella pertussis]
MEWVYTGKRDLATASSRERCPTWDRSSIKPRSLQASISSIPAKLKPAFRLSPHPSANMVGPVYASPK